MKYFGLPLYKTEKFNVMRYGRNGRVALPSRIARYLRVSGIDFDFAYLLTNDKVHFDFYLLKREYPFPRILEYCNWSTDLSIHVLYRFMPVSKFDSDRFGYFKSMCDAINNV